MALPPDFPMDTLREMINAGMGRAASSLNMLLDTPIELEIPSIAFLKQGNLDESPGISGDSLMSCIRMGFSGPAAGTALLVFSSRSAACLVATLVGQDALAAGLNALMTETLKEVGNIIINAVIGTIGNVLKHTFELSLPHYVEGKLAEILQPAAHPDALTVLLLVRTRFRAEQRQIDGNIFLIFELGASGAPLMALDPSPA